VSGLRLYPRLLGDAWHALAEPIRACYDAAPRLVASGRFQVTHARSWLARVAITIARMPRAGDDVALRLEVRAHEDHQVWERDFDDFRMTTTQYLLPDGRMVERRGPIELLFHVTVDDGAVVYRPAGMRLRLWRVSFRVPSWCGPSIRGKTWCEPGDRRMHVHIAIAVPFLGLIVSYGGAIERVDDYDVGPR